MHQIHKLNKQLKEQVFAFLPDNYSLDPEMMRLLESISKTYDHQIDRELSIGEETELHVGKPSLTDQQSDSKFISKHHLNTSQRIGKIGSWELELGKKDINENSLHWSDEAFRIFGFEAGAVQVTNELFFSLVHPDDRHIIVEAVDEALKSGKNYSIIHRLTNGKVVHERAEIYFDKENGTPLKMVGTIQDITEKQRVEHALEKANQELHKLFENMNEMFFSMDLINYQLIQISNACEKLYGRKREEFILNPNLWYEVVLDEDKKIIDDNYKIMNSGLSFVQEYRIKHTDGSIRWMESRVSPSKNNEGIVNRIDGITADITARKNAEILLKDSEHKFRALIHNSADAITLIDESSKVVFASDSIYKLTGFRPSEVEGIASESHVHPDDLPVINLIAEYVKARPGDNVSAEYRRLKKNGEYVWCEGTATNLLHDPAIRGIVINFREISERKKSVEELEAREHWSRALIENLTEAIIVTDDDFKVTFASDSLKRVAGYLPEEIKGKSIFTLSHPEEQKKLENFMQQVINHPFEPQNLIYKTPIKDGSYIWCERVSINLLQDPIINGIVSNFRDITESMEQQEALNTSNEELKKANLELDKFVYSASHDLRAPLASVLGLIEVSKMETSMSEIKELIGLMELSVTRLDHFIKDILSYSKNARTEIQKEKIDFTNLLSEITNNLKYMSESASQIAIKTNIASSADFYFDEYRLNIIFNNLLSNAIRYAKPLEEDPTITIEIDADSEYARIVIMDNGIGIKKNLHDRIFEMFFRASNTSTGSGLGLYIVKETLRKVNGTITLESEPDIGTKFSILIPNLGE